MSDLPTFRQSGLPNFPLFPIQTLYLNQNPIWMSAFGLSCSDSTVNNREKKLPWRDRKQKYLEHLRHAGQKTLIVAVADKLHNATAILADYREIGEVLWSRFSAGKEDQLWYYRALVETLRGTTAPSALVRELEGVVSELSLECTRNQ
jgi:hypothetical protein